MVGRCCAGSHGDDGMIIPILEAFFAEKAFPFRWIQGPYMIPGVQSQAYKVLTRLTGSSQNRNTNGLNTATTTAILLLAAFLANAVAAADDSGFIIIIDCCLG